MDAGMSSGGVGSPVAPSVARLQFRIFTVLWAIAALFHMAHSSIFDAALNLALLTIAAFYAILRPSLWSFLLLVALQIFDATFRMPFTTNHWIFTAFANFTILHVFIFLVIRNKGFSVQEGNLFRSFAPLLRIEVLILYFFAVFHKLNSGFFTPATSCATDLLKAQNLDTVIPLTDQFYVANAYLTLFIELSIPVLLCFRLTRVAGVIVGLLFHCVLSYSTYNAFYDFSSLMFAAYFVFLNPAFSVMMYNLFQKLRSSLGRFFQAYSTAKLFYTTLLVFVAVGTVYALNQKLDSYRAVHLYFFWTLYSVLFFVCIVVYSFKKNHTFAATEPMFRSAHWSLLIIPALVFINGTMPYVGLKTENSYAMFSNLRTEGGKTNHYIVPVTAQIFDYQKDVVQITSTTDPFLQQLAAERKGMVLFEFRNYVHEQKPARVDYLLNGEHHVVMGQDQASMEYLGRNPYLLKKLMKFRPFVIDGPQPCEH